MLSFPDWGTSNATFEASETSQPCGSSVGSKVVRGNIEIFSDIETGPRPQCVNTLKPGQDGRHFANDIFLNKKCYVLNLFSLKCIPKGPSNRRPSNENIFRVIGPFVRGILRSPVTPLVKANSAKLWFFLWSAPVQTVEQTIDTPVIWGANALIITSL